MFLLRKLISIFALAAMSLSLLGCNDPDERKTHYVTIIRSQDVEVLEEVVDTHIKKPTVIVDHPEGVEVRHREKKPRKSVSFEQLPAELLILALLFLLAPALCLPLNSTGNGRSPRYTCLKSAITS